MRRRFITAITLLSLIFPTLQVNAQSGDATWLESIEGLQTAIGRSWMSPISYVTESTVTEFNELGTPISTTTTTSSSATPEPDDQAAIMVMSALIFELDTPEHAQQALEVMNFEQIQQLERDPRAPVLNEFLPEDLGDMAFGHEGIYDIPESEGQLGVVYLMVQDGTYVYQIFGMFLPGDHIGIATGVAEDMLSVDASDDAPVYDVNGNSTGGNWEKLNAITIYMPEGSMINDLQVYPVDPDSVSGDSIVVPQIDLGNLADVPNITGSWHIAYQSHAMTELAGTPVAAPEGVFSIELWVLEFSDPTAASAAAFALDASLTEPLGVTNTEGSGFEDEEGNTGMTLVSTGFVRDRALPGGDAATVVTVSGTTIYAARVYANGPSPTPLAQKLVQYLIDTEPGTDPETIDGTVATGGMWQKFPESGSDLVAGLDATFISAPAITPIATPS